MNLVMFIFPVNEPSSAQPCYQGIRPKNKSDCKVVNCIWMEVDCLGWDLQSNWSLLYREEHQCQDFKVF